MSHVHPDAILSEPRGTLLALLEISWRLPQRLLAAVFDPLLRLFRSGAEAQREATSIWIAIVTAIFAPLLAHNWHLLLARPRWGIDARDGLLFPEPTDDNINRNGKRDNASHSEADCADRLNQRYGFHGFLYTSHSSKAFGRATLKGADAIWLHAHGGGFYAGEARMYHHTYKRWVEKAHDDFDIDLRILAVEYPLSTSNPYPGCIDAMYAAYRYVLESGIAAGRVFIAGDSAGGNGAISTCYRILEEKQQLRLPSPAGLIMLSPWLDLTRSTSGNSPSQPTDWLTTFDSDECRVGAIEQYMGTLIKSAADPRVSPLWREPVPELPKQFLSAGRAEVLFADSEKWAKKVIDKLGKDAIECHFARGQVHTFAIGGWLADSGIEEVSDYRVLSFVQRQLAPQRHKA